MNDYVSMLVWGAGIMFICGFFSCCLCSKVYAATVSQNETEIVDVEEDNDAGTDYTDDTQSIENTDVVIPDTGQDGYMGQDITDSVLAYLNFSYKIDIAVLFLLTVIAGSLLALLISQWYTR